MTRSEQYSFLQDLGNTSPIWPAVGAEQKQPESYCYLVRPHGECRDRTQFHCSNFHCVVDTYICCTFVVTFHCWNATVWAQFIFISGLKQIDFPANFFKPKEKLVCNTTRCHGGFGPPYRHDLVIWWLILFARFLSMFFSITTQYSSIKVKKTAISFQFCRIY